MKTLREHLVLWYRGRTSWVICPDQNRLIRTECWHPLFTQQTLFSVSILVKLWVSSLGFKTAARQKRRVSLLSVCRWESHSRNYFLHVVDQVVKNTQVSGQQAQCLTTLNCVVSPVPLKRTEQAVFIKHFQESSLFAKPYLLLRNQAFSLKFYLAHLRIPSPPDTASSHPHPTFVNYLAG